MEQKTINEQIQKNVDDMADATTGKQTRERINEAAQRESPIDEVRRLNKETKELVLRVETATDELKTLAAYTALSGKAYVTPKKEVTPEELNQEAVNSLAKALMESIR